MGIRPHNSDPVTMEDIAGELGLSKSTVSRALSDSGRISEETKRRVQNCADRHCFKPNLAAKALAGQCTMNIAAVMPAEASAVQMMFFHECLSGMVCAAKKSEYSVLVCMTGKNDMSSLESVIANKKVDACVLMQLKHDDENVALLKDRGFPFVVIGSGGGTACVDSKMSECCADFTRQCLSKIGAGGNVLFVCGTLDVEANNNRLSGFLSGMESADGASFKYAVCADSSDIKNREDVEKWDLILCSDDVVCMDVISVLKAFDIQIGLDVKIASFHDSILLERNYVPVSALKVDAFKLGEKACEVAVKIARGEQYSSENFIDCSYCFRESTF